MQTSSREEATSVSKIKSQLENWKKHLIDFSKRNQLLFFKARPSLTIEIREDPKEIFRKLILENRSLGFRFQVSELELSEFSQLSANNGELELPPDPDALEMPELEALDSDLELLDTTTLIDQEIDLSNSIQTGKDSRNLEQTLSKLKTRSQQSIQETGVNILYLAMYFLSWQDKSKEEEYQSPLILIPVSLERKGLSGAFRLNLIEDEIRINPTLAYKLDRDFGIDLNEIETELEDIDSLESLETKIQSITQLITQDHKDWQINRESCLSLFSFAKLSLYRDLEENETRIIEHPIIRQIAGEMLDASNFDYDENFAVKAEEIDLKLDAMQSMQILDADSSQEEAINAAKAGQSFVIQGPPGTGKSQTIANIIAESLAQNKKILFVSEKKSALEVVANRLKESKLDKFCLELHNSQRKKSEIINAIRTSLEEIKTLAIESSREGYLENINQVKDQIQKGISELHRIREPINKSLYEIYGELSKLSLDLVGTSAHDFTIPSIERIDLKKLSEFDYLFKQLASKQEILSDYDGYLWRNANVQNLSFDLENEIKANFIEFKNILGKLPGYANPISEKYFGRTINNISEFKWLAEASKLAVETPFPKRDWFNSSKLTEIQNLTVEAKLEHQEYTSKKEKILSRYSEGFLELNHQELLNKFTQKFTGIFRFLSIEYWDTINKVRKLSLYNEARSLEIIINDLQQAALLDKKSSEISKEGTELSLVLGDFYKEFDTDWNETITAISWVQKVLGKFNSDNLPGTLIEIISDSKPGDEFNEFRNQVNDLSQAYELLKFHINFYKSIFPNPNIDLDKTSFSDLKLHLDSLISNIIQIEDWIEFKELCVQGTKLGMGQFIESLIKSPIPDLNANIIKNLFLRKLYQLWVDKIEIENPEMRKFSGEEQQLLINKFCELDQKILERNKSKISKTLAVNWIEYASNLIHKLELQTLSHEINKKKKHKPIRLLIQEIPELLQTLKPCWMMSPLSVAQLIETNKKEAEKKLVEFDLIIFDEASQIRTEEAICSIYRGKQLILAGDSNQLPPTNFFNNIDNDDDFEDCNFESVLDECSVFLNSHTLNWHYRSRHEDLIKFSNYHIYDNQLITFPSPIAESANYGVKFELIENGYYEKGSRFNRREASRVAEAIVEHYKSNSKLSLGVIAFSEAQQFAIERELNRLLRKDTNLDQSFLDESRSDSLFIKNLENVQGDERDVIFFSIGYARDKKGNLSHNFGPLNRDGGHRRLNVAVTRARYQLKVFASIMSSDIDLSRTSAQGAVLLKKYLAFAENQINTEGLTLKTNNERFLVSSIEPSAQYALIEESIARSLEAQGYNVERFLGASDYKVDIAVRNPNNPNQFILAIETDGEIYRSAKTTRDRERLRKQVLESLGWKTHKIWARDWVRNSEIEIKKVLESLQARASEN